MRKAALEEEDAAQKNCTIMICQSVGPVETVETLETVETASKYEVGNGRKGVKIVKCEFISVIQRAISVSVSCFGPLMQLWLGHSTLHLHLSNVHCSMFIYFFIHQHHPPVFKGWALRGNVFPLSIEVLKNWVICVIIRSCMNSEDEQCEACFSPELKRFCLIAGAPASRSWVIVQYLKLSNWQQRSD